MSKFLHFALFFLIFDNFLEQDPFFFKPRLSLSFVGGRGYHFIYQAYASIGAFMAAQW